MLTAQKVATEAGAVAEIAPIRDRLKVIGVAIKEWARTCADYWSAAAVYDDLRRLSDAELHRRGLSRDTLARDVCSSFDSGGR